VSGAVPLDLQRAAGQFHADLFSDATPTTQCGNRRPGAAAASQRPSRATFVHAQADVARIQHLRETGVDAPGKKRVQGDARAEAIHARIPDVVDFQHRMRVAHRHHGNFDVLALDVERVRVGFGGGVERDSRGVEFGFAHLHGNGGRIDQAHADRTGGALQFRFVADRDRPVAVQPGADAARAVAALFGERAVGIADRVGGDTRRIARSLDHQQLVEADPGVAVAHGANHGGIRQLRRGARIEHDEVVAEAVHLGEAQSHGTSGRGQRPRVADAGVAADAAPAGNAAEAAGEGVKGADAGVATFGFGKNSGPFCPQPASSPAPSNSSVATTG
jgi:hypothetical protein